MSKFGKFTGLVLATILTAGTLTGCGTLDGTKTAATVDGENVTVGLLSFMTRDSQAESSAYFSMLSQNSENSFLNIWEEEAESGMTYGEEIRLSSLQTIQEMYVLRAHADEYDVSISEEQQAKIDELAAGFMKDNDEETIKKLAVSESDMKDYLELVTYQNLMYKAIGEGVDTEVSDEEANQTKITLVEISTVGTEVDENGNTIALTEEEQAEKKDLAEQVLKKVQESDNVAEADMKAIVTEIDPDLNATSRIFTTAGNEKETLAQEVKDAALSMKDGELVPNVIETEEAYCIVRLDAMYDAELSESKKNDIIANRKKEYYREVLDKWLEESKLVPVNREIKKIKVLNSKMYVRKQPEAAAE